MVLPGFNREMAAMKAAEIRTGTEQTLYLREQGFEVRLRASFGIATFPDHAAEVNGLLAAADHALFTVKRNGKDGAASATTRAALAGSMPGPGRHLTGSGDTGW